MPIETADDLAVFFDPEEFGEAAVFRPIAGGDRPVTVVRDVPTGEIDLNNARVLVDTDLVRMPREGIPRPHPGDRLDLVDGDGVITVSLEILGEARSDRFAREWLCEVRELVD